MKHGAFALVLGEIGGNRRLPIVIGNFEAKAIAIALDNEYKSQRPITHDLFKTLAKGFNINIQKVVISTIMRPIAYHHTSRKWLSEAMIMLYNARHKEKKKGEAKTFLVSCDV
ncbi:bifunctional nuclease family protein [bacterium]|nr:bifunctional nuclease family protein [bacterium]